MTCHVIGGSRSAGVGGRWHFPLGVDFRSAGVGEIVQSVDRWVEVALAVSAGVGGIFRREVHIFKAKFFNTNFLTQKFFKKKNRISC